MFFWGALYSSAVGAGADPSGFQLLDQPLPWMWREPKKRGYIAPSQYEALAPLPRWSAVGHHDPLADTFDDRYQRFLDLINPCVEDSKLCEQIDAEYGLLRAASGTLDSTRRAAYTEFRKVAPKGEHFFTWLGTPEGRNPRVKIFGARESLALQQEVYNGLIKEASPPMLPGSLSKLTSPEFVSIIDDDQLSPPMRVRSWGVGVQPETWQRQARSGEIPSLTLRFGSASSPFDFKDTWAGMSEVPSRSFWTIKQGGQWGAVPALAPGAEVDARVRLAAYASITSTPSGWYSGVRFFKRGPFRGSGPGEEATIFGRGGLLPMLKTKMWIGYGTRIEITLSEQIFRSLAPLFEKGEGLQAGPFRVERSASSTWSVDKRARTFTASSTSEEPFAWGQTVFVLPSGAGT